MDTLSTIGVPLLALVVGLIIGWLLGRGGKGALEAKIHQMEESVNAQNAEIAKSYSQVRTQDQRANSLLATNATLEKQARLAEEKLASIEHEKAQLQAELDAALSERDNLQAQLARDDAQEKSLDGEMAAALAANEELQIELANKTAEVTKLSNLAASLREELDSLHRELDYRRLTASAGPAAAATASRAAAVSARISAPGEYPAEPSRKGEVSVISAEEALAERDRALSDAYEQIGALRYSLSALTSLSADLSKTLDERNQSYEALLNRAAGVPAISAPETEPTRPSVVDLEVQIASKEAELADLQAEIEALQAAMQEASAVKDDLEAQLEAREAEFQALQAAMQEASAVKDDLEAQLGSRDAELGAIDERVADLQARVQPYLEETALAEPAEAEEPAEAVSDRLARLGALGTGVAAALAALDGKKQALDDANAQLIAVEDQLNGLAAEKTSLDLTLQEKEAALADFQAQIESLQGDLEATQAAKAQIEVELEQRSAELDEINAQISSLQAELGPFVAEGAPAEAEGAPVEGEEPAPEAEAAPPEVEAEEPGSERLVRMSALAAGVAGATSAIKKRDEDLAAAGATVASLQDQLNAFAADKASLEASVQEKEQALAEVQAQLESAQADLESTQAAKAQVEAELGQRSAELDEINAQISNLQAELQPFAAEVAPAEGEEATRAGEQVVLKGEMAAPEGEGEEPGGRRLVRMGALTAGVVGATSAIKKRDEDLSTASDTIASLQGQVDTLAADKASLEASLQEKEQALAETQAQVAQLQASVDNLSAQVDMLNQEMASVQAELQTTQEAKAALEAQLAQANADLETALAAKAEIEAELQERSAELDDLNTQISGFQDMLKPYMEGEEAPEEEGEERGGRRLVRMGALTAGVAGAVSAIHKRDDELSTATADLASLQEQLAALDADKASLSASVEEKEQALTDMQSQIAALQATVDELTPQVDALNAQVGTLQADLNGAVAAKTDLEATLEQRNAELDQLNAQLDSLQAELQPLVGEEELPAEGEEEEPGGQRLVRMGAITAGVAAATSAIRDKDQMLEEANMRAVTLQEQLESREAELADVKTRLSESTALLDAAPAVADVTKWLTDLPPLKRAAANAAIREGVLPYKTPKPQKLSDITGIGKVFEQRLYDAGIGTFWEISHIEDDQVQPILDITDWQMMRLDVNEVRSDAQRLAHESDTVGAIWDDLEVDDFEAIEGVGKVYERRLYEAGMRTYADIANATVEQLAEICHAPKLRTPDYAGWIAQAQALAEQEATE